MGKRNKEKRAAKKRDRKHSSAFGGVPGTPPGTAGFTAPPPGVSAKLVAGTLLQAARAHARGDSGAAVPGAADLSGGQFVREERAVANAVGVTLSNTLDEVWRAGWMPADVWQITRRSRDVAATTLLVDLIASDIARYASSTVDERWAAQVRELGAEIWWQQDRPHLSQWAERAGVSFEQAVLTAIKLLSRMLTLPELPRITPLPGKANRRSAASTSGVDHKVLARVRALLAKAESTQFPEEAEALSAKAQELMNRHAFERALLDADAERAPEAASARLWLDAPYVDAKASLVAEIADANRCKSVFYPKIGFVTLVGEKVDLEITELLATSLLLQATRAMVAEGSHQVHGVSRTRSFRQSFLLAYAVRVGERLTEASARAHDVADDSRLLPVLANRCQVVEETFQAMFSRVVRKSSSITNRAGWHAGRQAADRAQLTVERKAVS